MFIIIFCESALLPIAINYVAENFTGYASEVLTVLNCYRLVLGLLVPFFIDGWKTAVGPGWVFGSMALFTVAAFSLLSVVAYKGETIRRYSVKRIRSSKEGVTLH